MNASADGTTLGAALTGPGYAIVPNFLSKEELGDLSARLAVREAAGEFRPAATGAGAQRAVRTAIRGDLIHWLNDSEDRVESAILSRLEQLRQDLNAATGLGLLDLECHYAIYPPGTHYRRHLDRSPAGAERVVSLVLYLNEDWNPADGGELKLYTEPGVLIVPSGGTLVLFVSESLEHEVLPTRAVRLSLTGWFRRRASQLR